MLKRHRIAALLLAITLLIPYVPARAAAPSFSDIGGHWANAAILRWSGMGVLSGYPDRTFRPNSTVTRGELAAIINKLLGFPETPAELELFTDTKGKWYAEHVNALAFQGAYLVTHGEARGDAALTREEAAVMIYNSFPVMNPSDKLSFTDSDSISADYLEKITILHNTGFISGFPDGSFHPKELITRAQVLAIINIMIDEYITEPGRYENLEGKRVLVAVPGVILRSDCEYLVVSPSAGMGSTNVDATATVSYSTYWIHQSGNVWSNKRGISTTRRNIYTYDARFADGSGREDNPYLIQNQSQLALLADYLGHRNNDVHFALANDIILTGQWTPIGYGREYFGGVLDGRGYSIKGLVISSVYDNQYIGLFGYVNGGTIRNLRVFGDISLTSASNVSVNLRVGGICGNVSEGLIENCTSNVDITISTGNIYTGGIAGSSAYGVISDCEASGIINVSFTGGNIKIAGAGGIVGYAEGGIIDNCVSRMNVSMTSLFQAYAGGIAGHLVGGTRSMALNACQSYGTIKATSTSTRDENENVAAGGIAGVLEISNLGKTAYNAIITGCLSNSNVIAIGGYHASAGGFIGHAYGRVNLWSVINVNNCYTTGQVHAEGGSFQNNAGGFSGQIYYATIENCWSSAEVSVGKNEGAINVAGGFASGVYSGGVVKNCYATGSVTEYGIWFLTMAGSFTGRLEGSVTNCYATGNTTVVDGQGVKHAYNTIVGSRRGEGGIITQCADLTDNDSGNPFIIDEPTGGNPVETKLTRSQITKDNTFTSKGWDFDTVWLMPGPSDSYKLPILRGVFEDIQRALAMPAHLK